MDGWTVAIVPSEAEVVNVEVDLEYTEFTVTAELTADEVISKVVHFVAPEDYLGKKLHAYGGHLKYNILYNSGVFGIFRPNIFNKEALLNFLVYQVLRCMLLM